MSEIEIGEYVRTKQGQIDKLEYEINKDYWRSKDNNGNIIARCEKNKYWLEDIANHKKNIIDLIEVGDYVNGMLVIEVDLENEVDNQICIWTLNGEIYLLNDDIKTIVTKEQMESISYKVGE